MELERCRDKDRESHLLVIGCDATRWIHGTGFEKVWGKKGRVWRKRGGVDDTCFS